MEIKIATNVVLKYRQREKEPRKTSFDLGGSEIYLQDGVNGR